MQRPKIPDSKIVNQVAKPFFVKKTQTGGVDEKPLTAEEIALEKIAFDLYELCGVVVPKTYILKDEKTGEYSLASEFETGYQNLSTYLDPDDSHETCEKKLKKMRISGFAQLQAASAFLYDEDVIGRGYGNVGLVDTGLGYFRVVKIDPGGAKLTARVDYDGPYFIEQFSSELLNNGELNHHYIDVFQVVDNDDRLRAVQRIINIDQNEFEKILSIDRIPEELLPIKKRKMILVSLLERQQKLREAYAPQLEELAKKDALKKESKSAQTNASLATSTPTKEKYHQKKVIQSRQKFFPTGVTSELGAQPEIHLKQTKVKMNQLQLFVEKIKAKKYVDAVVIASAILTELHLAADLSGRSGRAVQKFVIDQLQERFKQINFDESDIKVMENLAYTIELFNIPNKDNYKPNNDIADIYTAAVLTYNRRQEQLKPKEKESESSMTIPLQTIRLEHMEQLVDSAQFRKEFLEEYARANIDDTGKIDELVIQALRTLQARFPHLSYVDFLSFESSLTKGILDSCSILETGITKMDELKAALKKKSILDPIHDFRKQEGDPQIKKMLAQILAELDNLFLLDRPAVNNFAITLFNELEFCEREYQNSDLPRLLQSSLAMLLDIEQDENVRRNIEDKILEIKERKAYLEHRKREKEEKNSTEEPTSLPPRNLASTHDNDDDLHTMEDFEEVPVDEEWSFRNEKKLNDRNSSEFISEDDILSSDHKSTDYREEPRLGESSIKLPQDDTSTRNDLVNEITKELNQYIKRTSPPSRFLQQLNIFRDYTLNRYKHEIAVAFENQLKVTDKTPENLQKLTNNIRLLNFAIEELSEDKNCRAAYQSIQDNAQIYVVFDWLLNSKKDDDYPIYWKKEQNELCDAIRGKLGEIANRELIKGEIEVGKHYRLGLSSRLDRMLNKIDQKIRSELVRKTYRTTSKRNS